MTPFRSAELDDCTDLQLPIGTFFETSGTFVNCEGRWQSFGGVANPVGQARPGWKVLRVLGNLLDAPDFDYLRASTEVLDELRSELGDFEPNNAYSGDAAPVAAKMRPRRPRRRRRCTRLTVSCGGPLRCSLPLKLDGRTEVAA